MIKLAGLLKESVNPTDSLMEYLSAGFNGVKNSRGNHTFKVLNPTQDPIISQSSSFDVQIDGKITIKATPILDAKGGIKGWKFSYSNWSEKMEYSPIHGYQGGWMDLFSYIKDVLSGDDNIQSEPKADIKMDDAVANNKVNTIKKLIDTHDWYYELTDASNTYARGSKNIEAIRNEYKLIPTSYKNQVYEYWNSKAPSQFKYKTFDEFNKHFDR